MKNQYFLKFSLLSALCFWGFGLSLEAQNPEQKTTIRIERNEAGKESVIIREGVNGQITDIQSLLEKEEILKNLGPLLEDEELEITIRKIKKGQAQEIVKLDLQREMEKEVVEMEKEVVEMEKEMVEMEKEVQELEREMSAKWNQEKGAFLGVYYHPDEFGITRIQSVISGTAAEKAGLAEGDIIVEVDDLMINADNELREVILSHEAGDKIKIEYERAGKKQKTYAQLGEPKSMKMTLEKIVNPAPVRLGVVMVDCAGSENGLEVKEIIKGSVAENIGLAPGDFVIRVNGEDVENCGQIRNILDNNTLPSIKVDYMRNDKVYQKIGEETMDLFKGPPVIRKEEKVFESNPAPVQKEEKVFERMPTVLEEKVYVFKIKVERPSVEELNKLNLPSEAGGLAYDDFTVSPNPSDGKITVTYMPVSSLATQIFVYDINGRVISKKNFEGPKGLITTTFNLDGNADGIFFVRVNQGEKTHVKKVILQN